MAEIAETLRKISGTLDGIYIVLVLILVALVLMLMCKDMGHSAAEQIRMLRREAERRNRR